jgi:hypothetical protein
MQTTSAAQQADLIDSLQSFMINNAGWDDDFSWTIPACAGWFTQRLELR